MPKWRIVVHNTIDVPMTVEGDNSDEALSQAIKQNREGLDRLRSEYPNMRVSLDTYSGLRRVE